MNNKEMYKIISSLDKKYRAVFTYDELKSDINLIFLECSKNYNPAKGNFRRYFKVSINNFLSTQYKKLRKIYNNERQLHDKFYYYDVYSDDSASILAFLKTLPSELIKLLTEYSSGEIEKEDLIKRSSYKECDITYILSVLSSYQSAAHHK